MHTDPHSLIDIWPRRNVVLRIPPKWLIFLALRAGATLIFLALRAGATLIFLALRAGATLIFLALRAGATKRGAFMGRWEPSKDSQGHT
jgi:hypothetical protein